MEKINQKFVQNSKNYQFPSSLEYTKSRLFQNIYMLLSTRYLAATNYGVITHVCYFACQTFLRDNFFIGTTNTDFF